MQINKGINGELSVELGGEMRRLVFDFSAKRAIDQLRNQRHEPTLMTTMSRWSSVAAVYGKNGGDDEAAALAMSVDCSFLVVAVFCAHSKHNPDKRFSERDVESWLTKLEREDGTVEIGALYASIMGVLWDMVPASKTEPSTSQNPT